MSAKTCRLVALLACVFVARPAALRAEQSVVDVLSHLVVNRSIPTGDFVGDTEAAAATRDALTATLLIELSTLPIGSSAGAFTYRLEPSLGTVVRSSESFGPFLTDRSLTVGRGHASVTLGFQTTAFYTIDDRSLRDGTLVFIARRLRGETAPFDTAAVTLRVRADTTTLAANFGVSDRFDVGAAVPLVRIHLAGERVDTYRGTEYPEATGSATTSGVGDMLLRAKYSLYQQGANGVAIGAEARLPTGRSEHLLGSGEPSLKPRVIGSFEHARLGVHGEVGYSLGGLSRELAFAGAVSGVARSNVTLIAEIIGRRFSSVGRLAEVTRPQPGVAGVDTVRLTAIPDSLTRLLAVGGIKWNIASTWLVSAQLMRPLTTSGLNARWIPTVTVDYSFGR